MYCNFCNSQLPEGVSVCAVCGHDNSPARTSPAVETATAAQTASAAYEEAPAPVKETKSKKPVDPLASGISALVWGFLSAIMSFGGLFLAMSFEGAIFGIVMSIISKCKAKAAKAYPGTVGAALAKGAGAASTFGLIASIYVLVNLIIAWAIIIFVYVLYFGILFIALMASEGMVY